jgi:rubrerythrin
MTLHFPTLHATVDASAQFECTACGGRFADADGSRRCPDCGATVKNIAVPRN